MFLVFMDGSRIVQHVVKIDKHKEVQKISEGIVHQGLKTSRGIAKSEGHD